MEQGTLYQDPEPLVKELFGIVFNPERSCGFDDPLTKYTGAEAVILEESPEHKFEVVEYAGESYIVHGTNNMMYLLHAYLGAKNGEPAPEPEESMSGFMYRRGLVKHPEMIKILDAIFVMNPLLADAVKDVCEVYAKESAARQDLRNNQSVDRQDLHPDAEQKAWRKIVLSYTLESLLAEAEQFNAAIDERISEILNSASPESKSEVAALEAQKIDATAWCQ